MIFRHFKGSLFEVTTDTTKTTTNGSDGPNVETKRSLVNGYWPLWDCTGHCTGRCDRHCDWHCDWHGTKHCTGHCTGHCTRTHPLPGYTTTPAHHHGPHRNTENHQNHRKSSKIHRNSSKLSSNGHGFDGFDISDWWRSRFGNDWVVLTPEFQKCNTGLSGVSGVTSGH